MTYQITSPPIEEESKHEFKCFICWESSTSPKQFCTPCSCTSSDLRYAHTECIIEWINSYDSPANIEKYSKCRVCQQPYRITKKVDLRLLFRNYAIPTLAFLVLLIVPMYFYIRFLQTKLGKDPHALTRRLTITEVVIIGILYYLVAVILFTGKGKFWKHSLSPDVRRGSKIMI